MIRVLAFGSAAEALGWPEKQWPLDQAQTLSDLIARLEVECPRILEARGRLQFAVNQTYAKPDTTLRAGDEVAIIPPVSGGEPDARIVREPIDLAALIGEVEDERVGAIATFLGVVRAESDDQHRALVALDYNAYEPMAFEEMEKICERASAAGGLHAVRLVHRLGRLKIGEASVAVVVSAPHRGAAFDACREIIEQLKASVPIFKREIWESGDESWVDGI